mmetsp:Transcript_118193/g.263966  ORF Transcript_118193/g.263966 Transcript_118193/m.263966 type:complete len:229 (+) Transcript_118193:497-1183(+)
MMCHVRGSSSSETASLRSRWTTIPCATANLLGTWRMKYENKAWLGNPSSPFGSLAAMDVQACVTGQRPNIVQAHSSNCRYYAGCALRSMWDFDKIPGVSPALARHCTGAGRKFTELDTHWMQADNEYWMKPAGARVWGFLQSLRERFEPGFAVAMPDGISGFQVGDTVRLSDPASASRGQLHMIESVEHGSGTLCLKRGTVLTGCFAPRWLRHVAADELMQEGMELSA